MSDATLVGGPAPHPRWGYRLEYLLAAGLAATGVAGVLGLFALGYAVGSAFALGVAASVTWRLFRGDRRRVALQLVSVLAWVGWVRLYWHHVDGTLGAWPLRAVGAGFLLAGVGLLVWLRRAPHRAPPPARGP